MTVYFASLVIPLAVLMPNALFVLLLPTRTPLKPPPVAGQTGQAQSPSAPRPRTGLFFSCWRALATLPFKAAPRNWCSEGTC